MQVKVYPNPVEDVLYLSGWAPDLSGGKIDLFDCFGRRILEVEVEGGVESHAIDLADVAAGVYIVRLSDAGLTAGQSLMVIKR